MALHLRQICLVGRDLATIRADLETVFGMPVCHVDPAVAKFGLENILLAAGSQFLEVVSPIQEGTAAGRYLDRRGGDGGYMVITQVRDKAEQDAVRANAAANGVRVAYDSDRGDWHIMQLHPGDMRGAFFEVEWDNVGDVCGHWTPAGGTEWQDVPASNVVHGILAAELQSDDPHALAAHWSAVSGLPVEDRGGVPRIALANAALRFVPDEDGRGPGLGALDIATTDAARIQNAAKTRGLPVTDGQVILCGTRFNLIE
ncbi:VOC family protein [Chachezhania antarctica]|uniref:VOC family protein n=1 Tax=Chachezhania antarctica TaxID=2340860 RepID=UPI000EAF4C2D|nr:VOC family protein [Chachezhania antarctica]|tara:strand:+ start:791 stop:1564 length:774 start_codon:yes stop_codon:yes gene_type:complete